MSEGYYMIATAMTIDPWLQFSNVSLADGGEIRKEIDEMMKSKKG